MGDESIWYSLVECMFHRTLVHVLSVHHVELSCGDVGCSVWFCSRAETPLQTTSPQLSSTNVLTTHAQGCDGTCIQPMNTIWIHLPLQCSPNQLNSLRVRHLGHLGHAGRGATERARRVGLGVPYAKMATDVAITMLSCARDAVKGLPVMLAKADVQRWPRERCTGARIANGNG